MVSKWSNQYSYEDKYFIYSPTIELQQWTDEYHWAKCNKIISQKIEQNNTEYCCPSGDKTEVMEKKCAGVHLTNLRKELSRFGLLNSRKKVRNGKKRYLHMCMLPEEIYM